MKTPCGNTHPLFNPGSTQSGRAPQNLYPDSFEYDERTVSDWLVYLAEYAEHINFFCLKDDEVASENWKRFFDQDISVLLARIAEEQVAVIQVETNALINSLQNDSLSPQEAREGFTQLFGHVFNIIWRLDGYFSNLTNAFGLKDEIANTVLTNIEIRLGRLLSYFKSGRNSNLFDEPTDQSWQQPYVPVLELENWELQTIWFSQSGSAKWTDYVNGLVPDNSPFDHNILTPSNDAQRINLAAHYQLLTESIKGLMQGFAQIILKANNSFQETIADYPDHQPDRALLIAFLQLLEVYRQEMNTLPKRHLDHYYKDVLQLKLKEPVSDSVFVVAEPAKNTDQVLLEEGTKIKAGKDDDGLERVYTSVKDTVVNQAKVVHLKNTLNLEGKVYSAQMANSADGLEADLEFPEKGWPAFGSTAYSEASMGFAIASDHLFMKDGKREISLTFIGRKTLNQSKLNTIATNNIAQLSEEEGWVVLEDVSWTRSATNTKSFTITARVPEEAGSVVAVSEDVHERSHYPELPVLELFISTADHGYLEKIELESAQIGVSVESSAHAELNSVLGVTDSAKPFQPFGAQPKVGNALVVGAQEMLAKNLTSLTCNVTWSEQDSGEQDISNFQDDISNLTFQQLQGGEWVKPTVSATKLSGGRMTYSWNNLKKQVVFPEETFSNNSSSGFLRLALKNEIGHAGFADEMATYGKNLAIYAKNGGTAPTPPKPYHIPLVESFTIDYEASASVSLVKSETNAIDQTQFFHITPFGGYNASGNTLEVDYPSLVQTLPNEGEFYIGISNLGGGESTSLLVHVVEGSANPLKAKQDVIWTYLHNNRWVEFAHGDLNDGTDGLVKTGLVELSLPFDFEDASTFFNEPVTWVRATIAQHPDAVCKVVNVYAQGLQAELTSTGHAFSHYNNPLPIDTATKLKVSNSAIKKLNQPVISQDGKPQEADDHFYVRVSERLRHKSRAVATWDYERMILEEFPELVMVKTLSHTRYFVDPATNGLDYSESAPGNVALVCVPQKQADNGQQRPYTPVDTLEEVQEFVDQQNPDWAELHVRNPLFEEVQVDCRVQFLPHIKEIDYYLEALRNDLANYLSPWLDQSHQKLKFGWRIHKSHIIDFIDERPYVDYVRDLKLNHIFGSAADERIDNVNEVIPRFAVSVLVSSTKHVLNPV